MKQFKRDQPTILLVSEMMYITLLQTGLQNPVQHRLCEQKMVTVKGNKESFIFFSTYASQPTAKQILHRLSKGTY
jgi:hypothetical protein